MAVHPGGLRALVAPHPDPCNQQEPGVGDKVEQVVEPAMRIIGGPAVQFGLDLQYPALCLVKGVLQLRLAGIIPARIRQIGAGGTVTGLQPLIHSRYAF
jgi:hypothetical protein